MKKNKKLLMYFLAMNSLFTLNAASGADAPLKYDKLYGNMVKNLETGKSNEENYKIIEKALNKRNKELKDLYNQSDYIVKPEYLEWQIFFSGFYTEKNGGDNTFGNAKYSSEVEGYYDATGTYVVTNTDSSTPGKPYQPLQTPKEIDLGMSIPMKQVNLTPISISPAAVAAPSIFSVSANVTLPTAPVVANLSLPAFTPTAPVVSVPTIFTPPALDRISSGFSQGNAIGVNVEENILGNSSATPLGGGTTVVKVRNNNYDISGAGFSWNGYNDGGSLSGTQGIGTVAIAYRQTFLNALAGSYTINGNWQFRDETTGTPTGNTARFVSVNHAYGARHLNTEFHLSGNADIYGTTNGHMTVGIEHQSYDALSAKAIIDSGSVLRLRDGENLFGMTLMIESPYYRNDFTKIPINTTCGAGTCRPMENLPIYSTAENRGQIIIDSKKSR